MPGVCFCLSVNRSHMVSIRSSLHLLYLPCSAQVDINLHKSGVISPQQALMNKSRLGVRLDLFSALLAVHGRSRVLYIKAQLSLIIRWL